MVANRIRNGTTASKIEGGVKRNSSAPAMPPTRLGAVSASILRSAVRSSFRYPHMPPSDPGQIATVLVAFAATEVSPNQISVGNVTNVPPPATELIAPAANAEAKAEEPGKRSIRLFQ